MKRFLITVMVFITSISIASAAVPDLSGLSSEDLLATIRQAQSLLFDQGLNEGIKVTQGNYIVGEDIPAGTYRIEIVDGTGYYEVYADSNQKKMLYAGITGASYNIIEIGKLVLENGNFLKLVNSSFIFYPYTGVFH